MSKESRILVTPEQQAQIEEMQAKNEQGKDGQRVSPPETPSQIPPEQKPSVQPIESYASNGEILDSQGNPIESDVELQAFNQKLPDGVSASRNEKGAIVIETAAGEQFALKNPPEMIPQQVLMSSVQMTIGMQRVRLIVLQLMLAQANIPGNENNQMLSQTISDFQKLFETFGISTDYWKFVETCINCPHMKDEVSCEQCPEAAHYKTIIDKRFTIWTPPSNIDVVEQPGGMLPPQPQQNVTPTSLSDNGNKKPKRKLKRRK